MARSLGMGPQADIGRLQRRHPDESLSATQNPFVRERLLAVVIALGVVVALSTEVLAFLGWVNSTAIRLLWTGAVLFVGVPVIRRHEWLLPLPALRRCGEAWTWTLASIVLLIGVGVVALAAAPGTGDSLTYHLPRVMHWIANASVDFYPTHIPRQQHMAPFTEYAMLHSILAAGSDRLVNIVQWGALASAAVAVSAIAARLGASAPGQALGAVLLVVAPMALLEGSSTKNDLVATLWCLLVVLYGLHGKTSFLRVMITSAALGLAALTKATTYVVLAPVVVLLALRWARELPGSHRVRALSLLIAVPLVLNAAQYERNYSDSGSPLGPTSLGGSYKYTNDTFAPEIMISNLVRNAAVELRSTSRRVNETIQNLGDWVHAALDVASDDPRSTWGEAVFDVTEPVRNEASSGNPIQFLAAVIACFVVLTSRKSWRFRRHAIVVVVGAFLFCLVLRWQPWHPRLHLPLLALSAPLVGTLLSGRQRRGLRIALGSAVMIYGTQFLLWGDERPLLGERSVLRTERQGQYFASARDLEQSYRAVAGMLGESDCERVGLYLGPNDLEYPLWALVNGGRPEPTRFRHVLLRSDQQRYIDPAAEPVCAVVTGPTQGWYEFYVEGQWFCSAEALGPLGILWPSLKPCPGLIRSQGLEPRSTIADLVVEGADEASDGDHSLVLVAYEGFEVAHTHWGRPTLLLAKAPGVLRLSLAGARRRVALVLLGRSEETGDRLDIRLDGDLVSTWTAEFPYDSHYVILEVEEGPHFVELSPRRPVALSHAQLAFVAER